MPRSIIVAVRDSAANAFSRPFFVPATGMAVRSFTDEVNRNAPDNPMFAHAGDFELYELGEFDEETGLFETRAPVMICRAKDVKREE